MKETGLIFGSWAIPKLLNGSKTQTRRTRGLELINKAPDTWKYVWNALGQQHEFYDAYYTDAPPVVVKCPYGDPGDRLWVREKHHLFVPVAKVDYAVLYWVDADGWQKDHLRWRPPIHMPKWAARIWLEIVSVRAERVQEISEQDAEAEGVEFLIRLQVRPGKFFHPSQLSTVAPTKKFECLWDSLNAKRGYGFDTNPWVWGIQFKGVE